MTLPEQAAVTVALSTTYSPELRAAIVATAVAVLNEDPGTTLHSERTALAKQALRDSQPIVDAFAQLVATNVTVTQKWAQGDLEGAFGDVGFVLATVWDALAVARAN